MAAYGINNVLYIVASTGAILVGANIIINQEYSLKTLTYSYYASGNEAIFLGSFWLFWGICGVYISFRKYDKKQQMYK